MQRPKIASARSFFVDWFHLCYGKGAEHARWLDVVELPLSCFPWLGLQCHPIVTCIRRPKSPPVAYSITMYSTSISSSGSRMRTMMQMTVRVNVSIFEARMQNTQKSKYLLALILNTAASCLMLLTVNHESCGDQWWVVPFITRTAKTSCPFLPRTRRGKSQCGRAGVPSTADLSCEVRLKPWNQVDSKKPGFPKDSRLSAKAWQALGSWISIQMRLLKECGSYLMNKWINQHIVNIGASHGHKQQFCTSRYIVIFY